MSVNYRKIAYLLNDGRPGHWRQVRALAHFLPVESQQVPVSLKPPWRWFAPYSLPAGLASHPLDWESLRAPPDVIISCGRRTSVVARWLKQRFEGRPKTVQILDCGLSPRFFDWVITPRHDNVRGKNVLQLVGSLNPVDQSWLEATAGLSGSSQRPGRVFALLPGGPGHHFDFSRSWFTSEFRQLCDQVQEVQGRLVVVESPRTPTWVRPEVANVAGSQSIEYLPWRSDEPAQSEQLLAEAMLRSDSIIVTADSINLASEACASGRSVYLMGTGQASERKANFCHQLISGGYARKLGPDTSFDPNIPVTRCLRETEQAAQWLIGKGLLSQESAQ